jgi:hypothetical protein
LELVIGTKPVASQLTFTLWLYASGFDASWRRYGVMAMLTVEVMPWALRSNCEVEDLLWPRQRQIAVAPCGDYVHARTRKVAWAARAFGDAVLPGT